MHYKSGLKICITSGGFNLCFAFLKKKLLIQYNLKNSIFLIIKYWTGVTSNLSNRPKQVVLYYCFLLLLLLTWCPD
jgi:phosphoserine phosphatase